MSAESIASKCLALSGLFEAELLVELMLRFWKHPFADDSEFRNQLLESAVEYLGVSVDGKTLISGIPPSDFNLVMAIWYAEWADVESKSSDAFQERLAWLETVKRSIPSCFSDQGNLE